MVKDFFLSIGTKGLGLSLSTNNYFNDPSAIWDKGREIGGLIIDQLSWRPATYIFILLGLLTYIGFFILAMRIIICWVEYYFLTGISIIFLPFGALNLGLEYYKNVFKTIMSCSIKLCVFNMWLLICDKLMKSIMVTGKKYDLDASLVGYYAKYAFNNNRSFNRKSSNKCWRSYGRSNSRCCKYI